MYAFVSDAAVLFVEAIGGTNLICAECTESNGAAHEVHNSLRFHLVISFDILTSVVY